MSHAVNLQAALPAKRRKLSSEHPHTNGLNGLLNGAALSLHATPAKNAKPSRDPAVRETHARLQNGYENGVIDLEESAGEGDEDGASPAMSAAEDLASDGEPDAASDSELEDQTSRDVDEAVDGEEPSFADLLRQRGEEPISIDLTDEALASKQPSLSATNRTLSVPTATTLGTVLTQALRTNDTDLLESCLQIPNLESIRATIERLHSSHAATLLQRLAERMHKRPGRAGSLMVWVQWTVVAHGGYLATQPAAMNELYTLYQVVKQRASGLQPLLALKGKLDMLEAQMQLRRNMQKRSKGLDPSDEGVIYIEGEEQSDSESEDGDGPATRTKRRAGAPGVADSESEADELEDYANGIDFDENPEDGVLIDGDEEDEADDDEDSGDDNLIDDEAEETDDDDDDSAEELSDDGIDYDDVDNKDEVSDSEDDRRPPKKSKGDVHRSR